MWKPSNLDNVLQGNVRAELGSEFLDHLEEQI